MPGLNQTKEQDSGRFYFWTPGPGDGIRVGPEKILVPLELRPLPVHRDEWTGGRPGDDAIGRGIFDFLKWAPDAPEAPYFAELLRDAFPHYLAEIGSQVLMLDAKEVDAPYVKRKINGLKILLLLAPANPDLLFHLGRSLYELALTFTELPGCRGLLLQASGYLDRSVSPSVEALPALNLLGRIDFLLGDYSAAERRWRAALEACDDVPTRRGLDGQIERLAAGPVPARPLVEDLEEIGQAMQFVACGRFSAAGEILERIQESGSVMNECPSAEFLFLLGLCREKNGDPAGAFEAFDQALDLDPENEPARLGRDRILDGRS